MAVSAEQVLDRVAELMVENYSQIQQTYQFANIGEVQILINPGIIAPFCSLSLNTNFSRYTSKFSDYQKKMVILF